MSSLVAPACLLSRPTRAGCGVAPGRPGAGPSAVAPHACRLRCHLQSLSRGSSVRGSSFCPSPLPPVPRAWRGVLALNQAAGLGSQPPGRATLYQPGPWWRSGFGVRFSVSPTIVKLFVWIQISRGLHLPTCWSQYLVSELTCEVCSQHSPHTRQRAGLPQRTHLEGSEREGVAVTQMLVVEAWEVSLLP